MRPMIGAVERVRLAGGHEDVALLLASVEAASPQMWDELIAPGQRLEVWEHQPTA
jgi:hypothetical protein